MAFDKFLLAPITDGVREDVKPWLIPDRAFEKLSNAYNFRGRIKKRVGSRNVGDIDIKPSTRLRIKLSAASGTVPLGSSVASVGQMFSIGEHTLTANIAGNPALLLSSGGGLSGTYDTTTGAYVINGAGATDIYFYPVLPVMGFTNFERAEVNEERTYAFDTKFSYILLDSGWERIGAGLLVADPDTWSGSDSKFFWSENYRGVDDYNYLLFTTNYNVKDHIKYYDGFTWNFYRPQYASNAADLIEGCRLIVYFQNRLLLLNTIEYNSISGTTNTIVNRCRYSAIGSPFPSVGPPAYWPFREDIAGSGSFIDAPTREAIISAVKLKNRLIVFFERSTYELVYTGNQVYPFIWQQINSTLGCESTFSVIPFDQVSLGVGENGIHACNGANVQRIDSKIPDDIFKIHNEDEGVFRVHGIRDYYNEMTYWGMPSKGQHEKFPDTILVYNYNNDTWAYFDDSTTAFGYYYRHNEQTWTESSGTWEESNFVWNSGTQESNFRYVIAGNQQGYTFLMDRGISKNALSQQITDITEAAGVVTITSYNHNLSTGDWIQIENATGITELNGNIYKIKRVIGADAANTFTIDNAPVVTGTYSGSGTIRLVSMIDIRTKRFNFYSGNGLNTNIQKTDFLVDKVDGGEITIDYLTGASQVSLRDAGVDTGAILGSGMLETSSFNAFEESQARFWHAVYLQAQGESIQLRIYWSDSQMAKPNISQRWLEIHGILFHASPTQDL